MIPFSVARPLAVRTMAQVLSVGVILVSLGFAFSTGVPPVWTYSGRALLHFGLSVAMVAGLAIGLMRPIVGGSLTWAAFVAFWESHRAATGGAPMGGAFALFPLAATLQMAAWWLERRAADTAR